jgi:streptogramin lyase
MPAPIFRLHKIPTERSEPYICIAGPDGCLWFCESGASKIARLDVNAGAFEEFAIPEAHAMPIGITPGADGNMWFCARKANKIGCVTMRGEMRLFPLPTPNAGPDGTLVGPDGNVWFSETDAGQIGRITREGEITEFKHGITPDSRPLSIAVRDGAIWFSEASAIASPHCARWRGHRVPPSEQRQPAARHGRAPRWQHLVRRDEHERARAHRSPGPDYRASREDAGLIPARRLRRA